MKLRFQKIIMQNNIIDTRDKQGDYFIDNIIIPLVKGGKNIILDESKWFKRFLILKTSLMENKIKIFVDFIANKEEDTSINFINSLNSKEKQFFIETINKVIDLDDNLQIYLLAYLLKEYKKNGDLDYHQKTLYYNIKIYSEDDFNVLYDFIQTLKQPIEYKKYYGVLNDDILTLTMRKFERISLISGNTGGFSAEPINLEFKSKYDFAFKMYPFIEEICEIVKCYKNKKKVNENPETEIRKIHPCE